MVEVKALYDKNTNTLTYVVWDNKTRDCLVIDPVLDYDQGASKTSDDSFKKLVEFLNEERLKPSMILETHAHADHLSGAQLVKKHFGGIPLAIGENIKKVQKTFAPLFAFPSDFPTDGSQFDRLLKDGEEFSVGGIKVKVLHTPGHTPACSSYVIGGYVFVGDLIFMPDSGTGRCDFPGGDAKAHYHSIKKLYALPDETKVMVCHDYQPNGRELKYQTTIGDEKRNNTMLKATTTEEEYVKARITRDENLPAPKLLLPSIQVNIRAGVLPEPESNGKRYLNIPIS